MAINTAGAAQSALSVFGGLVTEMAPPDLPEGVSPDCQDVVFAPGEVANRPCLKAIFTGGGFPATSPPFPAPPGGIIPTLTYAKSFVSPQGVVYNLYLDSNGYLWVENVSTSPGNYTQLAQVPPTGMAKSVTAFGREYLAISDGMHGLEAPLQWDGTNLDRVTQDGPGAPPTIANLVIPAVAMALSAGSSITRTANVVTVHTAAAHGLQIGYQAQITGVGAQPVDFISTIVIKNADNPGIATVTTTGPSAHGLVPGDFVSLTGISPVVAGTGISSWNLQGAVLTVITSAPHGLSSGSVVTLKNLVDGTSVKFANTTPTLTLLSTPDINTLIFNFPLATAPAAGDHAGAGGTVNLNWPLSDSGQNGNLIEVVAVPSPLSFQIELAYSDGTWTTGAVFTPWDGTFFVASVPSSTSFTYLDAGPDGASSDIGTVAPLGQSAPGQHQLQVLFLTRNDYVTQPSPPVKFIANGDQYLRVTNLPIGPPNVVARILAFTGAQGSNFFYIPAPAQVNGQIVSTSTQINDNTTTAVTLDFSDNSLFAGLAINIQGNNLPAQILIEGALSFGSYANRLLTWGQRNRIQNLLNTGFDGGYVSTSNPLGWTNVSADASLLVNDHYGMVWKIPAGNVGHLTQSFFQDAYGAPIATEKTLYRCRAWFKIATPGGLGDTVTVKTSSVSAAFSSTVVFHGNTMSSTIGGYLEATFNHATPAPVPADMLLEVQASTTKDISIDDISIIFDQNPYTDATINASYIENPEAFDGLSGLLAASDDTRKVMDFATIRSTLYFLTQDPSGRLHATSDNGITEPKGWTINEVASNCGLLSPLALTKSQADNSSGSGGEEWMAWASSTGARIFDGSTPWKISQEIQPDWDSIAPSPSPITGTRLSAWALNDPASRTLYFGLDIGGFGAPSRIYGMSYRELDTASQIASSPPIRTGYSGKLIATDHNRKWTRWNLTANGAALMYRQTGALSLVVLNGNGVAPGITPGFGNVYTLDATKSTDDDYGLVDPYYVTYFFVQHEQEQGLTCMDAKGNKVPLGAGRKLLSYLTAFVSSVGQLKLTFFPDTLSNPWPLTVLRTPGADPKFDIECGGGSAVGQRIAVKFESIPAATPPGATDNGFRLQKVVAFLRRAERAQVRGAAQ